MPLLDSAFEKFPLIPWQIASGAEQPVILLRRQSAIQGTQNDRAQDAHLIERTTQAVPQQGRAQMRNIRVAEPRSMLSIQWFIGVI